MQPPSDPLPASAPVSTREAPAAALRPPGWLRCALAGAVIALMALAAYANTFHVPFYFDDRQGISENQTIDILWPPWRALNAPKEYNSGAVGRPLVNFSLAVNYQISEAFSKADDGFEPWSYHAVNLAIHIATAWLLMGVAWRTLRQPPLAKIFGAAALPLAFLIALAWAVHPLASETVTNAIQRNESMVSFFYLGVIYCLIRSTEEPLASRWLGGAPRSGWWQGLAVVACFLGVLSKEVMFSAPLMALLYDRTFVAGSLAEACRRRWKFYAAMATSWILLGWLVHHYNQRGGTVGFDLPMSKYEYALKQCEAIITYFSLCFWPHPLVLDYGYDVVTSLKDVWPQALALAALVGGTFWALWKKPAWGFAGMWVFLILAPSSSIMPLTTQTEAEHRMYLPLAMVMAVLILGAYALSGPRVFYAAGALALVFTGVTYSRNKDYRSEVAMWYVDVAQRPQSPRAHYNLGCALLNEDRYIDASSEFMLAMQLEPDNENYYTNLGACYADLGDAPRAMEQYKKAVKINPKDVQSNYNLGCEYRDLQDYDKAAEHLRVAVENNPSYREAQYMLGLVLVLSDHSEEALKPLKAALDLDPNDTDTLSCYGQALLAQGLTKNAIAILQRGLALDADNAELHKWLAEAYADDGQDQNATVEAAAATRLAPNSAEMHLAYGHQLFADGKYADAAAEFTTALKLRPAYAEAENDLGGALLKLKRNAEARAAYAQALEWKPDLIEARLNLGRAMLADGQLVQAETQFRQALQTDKDNAEAHLQLGKLLQLEKRYNEATFEFQEALRIQPDDDAARASLKALQDELGGP